MGPDRKRIPFEEMQQEFLRILLKFGLTEPRARVCAEVFAENSLDGVNSHGVNRFPHFIDKIKSGRIVIDAVPERMQSSGALEQWNGNLGPGPLNALACTDRAGELAQEFGLGCVALSNTNHWMRGGTYGWRAATNGYIFCGWSNTEPNLPAWGAKDCRLGNNPIVLAVPKEDGPVVLDMALSQFSYGKLQEYSLTNLDLPVPGGFTENGQVTKNAAQILSSHRPLPIGYWKGAGLSLLLDIIATILSGGLATHQIGRQDEEYNLSQVFIAFDLSRSHNSHLITETVENILEDYKRSAQESPETDIRYPGERALQVRKQNLSDGIPVDSTIWDKITNL